MMLLDGFFSFLALLSALMAVIISKFSRKTTKYYPHGLYFLEPLYAFFKAVLMLVLMVYALITSSKIAFDYFIHGNGQVMETAPLPLYAVAMYSYFDSCSFPDLSLPDSSEEQKRNE